MRAAGRSTAMPQVYVVLRWPNDQALSMYVLSQASSTPGKTTISGTTATIRTIRGMFLTTRTTLEIPPTTRATSPTTRATSLTTRAMSLTTPPPPTIQRTIRWTLATTRTALTLLTIPRQTAPTQTIRILLMLTSGTVTRRTMEAGMSIPRTGATAPWMGRLATIPQRTAQTTAQTPTRTRQIPLEMTAVSIPLTRMAQMRTERTQTRVSPLLTLRTLRPAQRMGRMMERTPTRAPPLPTLRTLRPVQMAQMRMERMANASTTTTDAPDATPSADGTDADSSSTTTTDASESTSSAADAESSAASTPPASSAAPAATPAATPAASDALTCGAPGANDATISLIKHFEGFVPSPAPDPIGLPTVGFGHKCTSKGCAEVGFAFPLSQDTASQLLQNDLGKFVTCVNSAVSSAVTLTDNQVGALSSFSFNLGCGTLKSSTLLKRLNAGEDPNTVAAQEIPRFNKAGGKVLTGLTNRRAAEVTLFQTPSQVKAHPC
ncbi:lysozyme-like domain-containing protein [Mycena rosella]|uniref:Lysozyme-like domain-containing protein n=1 Tax=Mycena rosella TaxID=1033263 RepID=A0AAD7CRA9_MYCRO|nr:lysozyme-like domain-containing protein [Mycena rosella]